MTWSYTAGSGDDLDRVRVQIQDVVENSGPLPRTGSASNFADEELNDMITAEGSWQRATANAFEVLASAWRTKPDLDIGPRSESYSQVSEGYAADAQHWRKLHGTGGGRVVAVLPLRRDGYSGDTANTYPAGSEFT